MWFFFFLFSLVCLCFCAFVCQSVHVGAAREHSETLHLFMGDFHHLLCHAIQTNGLHDWWDIYSDTHKASLSFWHTVHTAFEWMQITCKSTDHAHTQTNAFINHLSCSPCACEGQLQTAGMHTWYYQFQLNKWSPKYCRFIFSWKGLRAKIIVDNGYAYSAS